MEVGFVGLPGAGKTTLFNALTGSQVDAFAGGQRPNLGVAKIPDPRLATIASFIPPQKLVSATLQLVDIPGVAAGGGAEKLNAFLSHVRTMDVICHVVRCFDDGVPVNAAGNLETMETELVLADLVVVEGAREKASRTARSGDKDAKLRVAVLDKAAGILEEGRPLRAETDWSDAERAVLRSYGMISAKPVLYVANIGEDDIAAVGGAAAEVAGLAEAAGGAAITVCAKLEAELSELDDADRQEMLESMGLVEPAVGPLARALNALMGLSTFYTAGEKEVRAWIIPMEATAPEAAGAIHSDLQRGFIRAECYSVDDLVELKTEKAIREAGRLRSEGKNYQMQDGDVVHFLFNV